MKTLWDQMKIKNMTLKNRFIRSALWMKMADDDGRPNEDLIKTYETLAKGGVGLILSGYAYVDEKDQPNPKMMGIYDDRFRDAYCRLTEVVHENDSKIALQIAIGGSQCTHPNAKDMFIFGPSAVENRVTKITPKEMTKNDIRRAVEKFADAAARAKSYGFDAVQIHAAHGYFLSQFLSPYYNRRKDEYGGTIHNRARIIYDVIEAVRNAVGESFPILLKINHDDFMDDHEGMIFEEALEVLSHIDTLNIDAIEISGVNESSGKNLAPAQKFVKIDLQNTQSYFFEKTKLIAAKIKTPVILMGGNRDFSYMTELINTSEIEYVSIARPLLSESDLVNVWKRDEQYLPKCISCNRCWETVPNSCILNR